MNYIWKIGRVEMKRYMIVVFALLIMAVSTGVWAAIPTSPPWTGTLTGSGGGITATEQWNAAGTSMKWTVNLLVSGLYKYDYIFTVPDKDISHILIETSRDIDIIGYEKKEWGEEGNSNPGIPSNVYGVKIPSKPSGSSGTAWTFGFTSAHAPVWGDFYAKSGNGTYAHNTVFDLAFNTTDYIWNTPVGTGNYLTKIAVPDSFPAYPKEVVPEASTLIGFGSALAMAAPGLAGWLRRRRA
jgi:hypothetical protein